MGFFDNLKNNALDQVAEQRARSPKPSKKNSISPDRDLLLRVAAGGEGGAQGFQAQRDAQATQDAGVAAAAAGGRFPLDLEHTPSDPSAPGGTDQLGAPPSETRLGPSVRDQLDFPLPRQPGADPNTPNDPVEVAASLFSTDEDIMRALLGLPAGAGDDVLSASFGDLNAEERDLFIDSLNQLTAFQDRRTSQQDSVTDRARQEEAFELQQTQAAEDRVYGQLLKAKSMAESGDFTPEQTFQATGVDSSQFGDGGIEGALTDLEEKAEQTARILSVMDFDKFDFGNVNTESVGFDSGPTEFDPLARTAANMVLGRRGRQGERFSEDEPDTRERDEFTDFIRNTSAGVSIEQDLEEALQGGTPFGQMVPHIRASVLEAGLGEEAYRALIDRWGPRFFARTNALADLLDDE